MSCVMCSDSLILISKELSLISLHNEQRKNSNGFKCLHRSMILRFDKSETSGLFMGSNDSVSSCHCHVSTQNDRVDVCYEAIPTAFW